MLRMVVNNLIINIQGCIERMLVCYKLNRSKQHTSSNTLFVYFLLPMLTFPAHALASTL